MNRNRTSLAIVVLLTGLAVAIPSTGAFAAQGRGQGRKAAKAERREDKKEDKAARKQGEAAAIDREAHLRVIREYGRGGSLPPGLQNRRQLPPGLRRQLRERGALPPGLQKHLVPVPGPLITRLPAIPPYYQRYFAGDDLIVVDSRTDRIAAIIRDVLR